MAVFTLAVVIAGGVWLAQRTGDPAQPVPPGAAGPSAAQLDRLTVAVEDTGAHYRREDWGDWASQGNSCDTRELVLQRQGTGVRTGSGCSVTAGSWTSRYDDTGVDNARQLDIDHLVPVKEANRSGARNWTREQRVTFYNDLDNLVAVTASSNRGKGDSDPAHWRPPARGYWCGYATGYLTIKLRYGLSADQAEYDALRQMLGTCPPVAP